MSEGAGPQDAPPVTGKIERLEAGALLGDTYEIEALLATGGMAEVFRARNVHTDEPVAVKAILPAVARDATMLALFKKEATVLSRLHHDAIVRYYHFTVDRQKGIPYLVMELVNGTPLNERFSASPLDPEQTALLLTRIASGLSAAHGAGVIHRDLSPDNVILPDNAVDRSKIIDFGIAKAGSIGGHTVVGDSWAGKYNYMSPEQLGLEGGEITPRSDIYSLGLIAVAALRGKPIDMSGALAEVIEKRRSVPDLAGLDIRLQPVIAAMLEPRPQDRPNSMQQVIERVAAAMSRLDDSGTVVISRPAPPPPQRAVENSWPTQLSQRPVSPPSRQPALEDDSPFGPPAASGVGERPTRAAAENVVLAPPLPKSRGKGGYMAIAVVGLVVLAGAAVLLQQMGIVPSLLLSAGTSALAIPEADSTVRPPVAPEPDAESLAGAERDRTEALAAEQRERDRAAKEEQERLAAEAAVRKAAEEAAAQQQANQVPSGVTLPGTPPAGMTVTTGNNDTATTTPDIGGAVDDADWVKRYPLGACQYATITSVAENAVGIDAMGMDPQPFRTLMRDFVQEHDYEPDIMLGLTTPEQCGAIDFLRAADQMANTGPQLDLSRYNVPTGETVEGHVSGADGWVANLLLVDPKGVVSTVYLKAQGELEAFSLAVSTGSGQAAPMLLIMVAQRSPSTPLTVSGSGGVAFAPLLQRIKQQPQQFAVQSAYFKVIPAP
ncbi:serine/threonine protein kinase [Devosia sp. UYZn731]|uniref:serine/threonine protein kinase n=1 Tax=Devosia sp. UYZn731 TaxID=3156345 RepID=UPI0033930DE5